MTRNHQIISSILDELHCSLNDAFLIGGMDVVFCFQKHAGLGIPCVTTICGNRMFVIILTRPETRFSASSIFRSFDMLNPRIPLSLGSMAIQSQMRPRPTLIAVSYIVCSAIFFLCDGVFLGLCFCVQFQTEARFLLVGQDDFPAVLLNYKPEQYKYKPQPLNFEGVLGPYSHWK